MAVINFTGQETGDNTEAIATAGTFSVQATTKRTGGYALRCNPAGNAAGHHSYGGLAATGAAANLARTAKTYYTFYVRFASLPGSTCRFAGVYNSSLTPVVRLDITSGGAVTLVGATTSATIATISAGTWYRVDLDVTSNGTSGCAIDGGTRQTCTAANVTQDRIALGRTITTENVAFDCYYDDLLISDSAFPGRVDVKAMRPSGNGNYTGWTQGSANSYTEVDDDAPGHDTDTTYIRTDANGDSTARTFTLTSTSSKGIAGSVHAAKAHGVVRSESTTGTSTVGLRIRNGSTDVDATGLEWGTTYTGYGLLRATNPSGGAAWTTATLDTAEIGVWAGTIAQSQRCTALWLMVATDGVAAVSAAATLDGSGTLDATAKVTVKPAATLGSTGSLTGVALDGVRSAAALSSAGALTAAPKATVPASAAISGAGTLSASATVSAPPVLAAATLAGSGTLTAAVEVTLFASAVLSGSGDLAASVDVATSAAASLSAAGTLAATVSPIETPAEAGLSGSGDLAAVAEVEVTAAASLSSSADLAALVTNTVPSAAALSANGTLAASASALVVRAAAALSGAGTVAAAGLVETSGAVGLSGTGTLTGAISAMDIPAAAALGGEGSLAASATIDGAEVQTVYAAASVQSSGQLDATASVEVIGEAVLTASGQVAAGAAVLVAAATALLGYGTLAVSARARVLAAALFGASGVLSGIARAAEPGSVSIAVRAVTEVVLAEMLAANVEIGEVSAETVVTDVIEVPV